MYFKWKCIKLNAAGVDSLGRQVLAHYKLFGFMTDAIYNLEPRAPDGYKL